MNGSQFEVELTLGTTDPIVEIDPSASSAIVVVIDNDGRLKRILNAHVVCIAII